MERKLEVITKDSSYHMKKWIYGGLAECGLILLYKMRLFYVPGQKSVETGGGEITDAE